MGAALLGIDVGQSFLKVAAFDADTGRLLDHGQAPCSVERHADGRVEEDPEHWIDLTGEVIRAMLERGALRAADIVAMAPSARGSGAIFLDNAGRVIAPLWHDRRAGPQATYLQDRFGPEADNRSLASTTLHFKECFPELFARLHQPLCAHDFVLFRLSGVVATDPSSGPRSRDRQWPPAVWQHIGATPPPVRPHTELAGLLLPEAAARLGLPASIPVAVGGHDGACANVGAGAIEVGQVCVTMGTNVVARTIAADPAPQLPWRGISAYHFLPGRWCCGGDATYAGAAATWLARALDRGHDELEAAASRVPPGSDGLVFLPFFRGQIAPEMRSHARAAYLGISPTTGPAELYRATLEGVAFLYRWVAERLAELGLGDGDWRVSGGGARNRLWMEIMAAMIGRPLLIGEPEEGPRGAAMFAAIAAGRFPTLEACAAGWIRTVATIDPDPILTAASLPHYERYRRYAEAVHSVEAG